MATVTISHLEKEYRGVRAIRNIDLEVRDGEFVVLVGPSGCGKSTLLRMIAGLEDITGGQIAIDGEVVNDMQPRQRNVAMVFQDYALYPHMTVEENIGFALRARKIPEQQIAARVDETAKMLGISPLLKRYPRQLSGGQRQRVAIGRAVVRDARLFLFDEPLSNLDAQLRDDMRTEIKRLHQDLKRTMIYVTHDQIEAMTLADRVVLMRDGVIEQQGTPLELFNRPQSRFVAGFLGSPKMNFIPGVTQGKAIVLPDGTKLPLAGGSSGAKVIVGIRPQHITRGGNGAVPKGNIRAAAIIELVQPTGSRTQVTFPFGGRSIVAEFDTDGSDAPGKKINVNFDMSRCVVIDAETEKVIP